MKSLYFFIFRYINILSVKLNLPSISAICFFFLLRTFKNINYKNTISKKVIVLYRNDGLADLSEAYVNKHSDIRYLIFPRIVLKDVFNHFLRFQVTDYCYKDIGDLELRENKKKYYDYLKSCILILKKIIKFDAIISFNIFYYAERELQKVSKDLKIKYLVLMKEGISPKIRDKQLIWTIKNLSGNYFGDYVITYNRRRMKVLIDSGAVKKNKIEAIGVPRYDKIFNYSKNLKQRKTLVYYSLRMDAGFFDSSGEPPEKYKDIFKNIPKQKSISKKKFNNILNKNEKKMITILTEFAKKNANYDVIVKYKNGEEANFYHKPKNIPKNLKFIHGGSGYKLLKHCKLAIGFNSSALIEAVLASSKVLVVSFGIKNSKFKDSFLEYGGHAEYISNEYLMKKKINDIMLNGKLTKIKKPFKKKFIDQVGYLDFKSGNRLIKVIKKNIKAF